jgi:hypothetical protein
VCRSTPDVPSKDRDFRIYIDQLRRTLHVVMATRQSGLKHDTAASQPYSVDGKAAIVTGAGSGKLYAVYCLMVANNPRASTSPSRRFSSQKAAPFSSPTSPYVRKPINSWRNIPTKGNHALYFAKRMSQTGSN